MGTEPDSRPDAVLPVSSAPAIEPVPAVVLGLSATGLAVARALGRRGVRVTGVDTLRTPSATSRFVRFRRSPTPGTDAMLRFLIALAGEGGARPVLLATADEYAELIALNHDRLAGSFRLLTAPAAVVRDVSDKTRFMTLAADLGLPVPRAVTLGSGGVPSEVGTLRFPVVVKPDHFRAWSSERLRARGLAPAKAIPVADPGELRELVVRLGPLTERAVVQEMVVGQDDAHVDYHALAEPGGQIRAEFVGRKLRLSPPHFGLGTYVVSAHDPEVASLGREVLARLGYVGVANLNFKRDQRDGSLWLLEVNPRFSLWTALDVACGVDLPYWAYLTACGIAWAPPPAYPAGRRWVHALWDLRSMSGYRREAGPSWWSWMSSVLRADVEALGAWDDPLPLLASVAGAALRDARGRLPGRTR